MKPSVPLEQVEAVPQIRTERQGHFVRIGNANSLFHDAVAGEGADFLEQPLVINVGDVNS